MTRGHDITHTNKITINDFFHLGLVAGPQDGKDQEVVTGAVHPDDAHHLQGKDHHLLDGGLPHHANNLAKSQVPG